MMLDSIYFTISAACGFMWFVWLRFDDCPMNTPAALVLSFLAGVLWPAFCLTPVFWDREIGVVAHFQKWREKHGHRQADQTRGSGAERDAGQSTYFNARAGEPIRAGDAVAYCAQSTAGAGGMIRNPERWRDHNYTQIAHTVTLNEALQRRLEEDRQRRDGYYTRLQQQILRSQELEMRRLLQQYITPLWPDTTSSTVSSKPKNCDTCGAAHRTDKPHTCAEPSEHDYAVVRTIQSLAATGLSAEEIAEDMGLRVGWRAWDPPNDRGLEATGSHATWQPGRPMLAVCTNKTCCGEGTSCDGHGFHGDRGPHAPMCRLHAVKTREQLAMFSRAPTYRDDGEARPIGMVAMWGEVIECEEGWLATRAYPLAFASPFLAAAYGVVRLEEGEAG